MAKVAFPVAESVFLKVPSITLSRTHLEGNHQVPFYLNLGVIVASANPEGTVLFWNWREKQE